MYQRCLCILLFIAGFVGAHAQCPPNVGFEQGRFTNWDCFKGRVESVGGINVMTLNNSAPTFGHHTITDTADGMFDPYGNFPQTCPYGGGYSVMLGNEQTNKEADGMTYMFTVPTGLDTFVLTFFYAVVLQNPGHAPSEQPRFTVSATDDMNGTVVNCSNYDFVADGGIPGFQISNSDPTVVYKDWTPASLQFVGMGGRNIKLDFRVSDCTRGGHFGYAYIDVSENCSGVLAAAPYCTSSNSLQLSAPYGFQNYTWYNSNFSQVVGNGQSVTLSPPPPNADYFWVDLEPYPGYGCRDTLKALVAPYPSPDTPQGPGDLYYCLDQPSVAIGATATNGNVLLWYTSATGGTGSTSAPVPNTSVVGTQTFWVSQKQLFGCEGPRRAIRVNVFAPVPLTMSVNQDRQCFFGNSFTMTNTTVPIRGAIYWWIYGDGGTDHASAFQPNIHSYLDTGTFQLKLHVTNGGACSGTVVHNVTVIPSPTAVIGGPQAICLGAQAAVLSDSSLAPGSSVSNWWWNIGGSMSTLRHPALPASATGPVPVSLVVTTAEGCRSDTARTTLSVHNRPAAAFSFSGFCDNEPLQLRDQSTQPANTLGETISGWFWSVDGAPLSTLQNPDVVLSGGQRTVRLIVQNNFGCTSDAADSIITLSLHPRIAVMQNDSCAGRPMLFTAQVLSGSVSNWRWNLGAGSITGVTQVRQTYLQAGTRFLQLIATAPDGCRDTIARSLNVYANRAFAGRDTMTAIGEPVQLNAQGDSASTYSWSPADGLTDAAAGNPIALWPSDKRYELYSVDRFGCESRSSITVKRYHGPELYVPAAFTPNADGRNDRLRVRPVGIKTFHYLALYNRNGELLFRTTQSDDGWDGTFRNVALGTQTVIYVTEGTDYRGQKVFRKGTVTLLR
ncbi:MAG: T9SS type B sorting domain-containing protein [Chitinophagaceae bacterium]|nr:MAG: T9SS type B sorting domain-containing protein [Chitinophagaceae bacterium]